MVDCLSGFVDLLPQAHAFIRRHSFSSMATLAIAIGKGCIGYIVPVVGFPGMLSSQGPYMSPVFTGRQRRGFKVIGRTVLCVFVRIAGGSGKEGRCPQKQENGTEEK